MERHCQIRLTSLVNFFFFLLFKTVILIYLACEYSCLSLLLAMWTFRKTDSEVFPPVVTLYMYSCK